MALLLLEIAPSFGEKVIQNCAFKCHKKKRETERERC